MPTGIENFWQAMDHDVATGTAVTAGWLLRLARPDTQCPLFAAVELATRRRAILLRLPVDSVPSRRRWPRCKGLDPLTLRIDGKEHFGVALKEERFTDVFTSLSEDLLRRVSEAASPEAQARAFLGQLSRWQKFLSASSEGLTDDEQRGLWGELKFLRDHLCPILGTRAVLGWKGPEHAHHDYQFNAGAIEVKTTLAKQPQVVRITSERQLDGAAWPILILYIVALDNRDSAGETLPQMVAAMRTLLAGNCEAQEQFEDKLLLVGYQDAHALRYADHGYVVRTETFLRVQEGFPLLSERNLPSGVGDVSYGLTVAACTNFAMSEAGAKQALAELSSAGTQ
jgi:hypothetical protein